MSTIRMLELAQNLANQFSRTIRSNLTPEQMMEVLRRNRYYSPGTCATHDFCDANIDMAEAFKIVIGHVPNLADPTHAAVWSAAWEMARNGNLVIPPTAPQDEDDELPTTFAEVRARFPGLKPWPTGVGCYALRQDCDDGSYILVTQRKSPKVPADDADEVDVARYAVNGDVAEAACSISVETLEAWMDAALSCASESKTIAEYFFKKLGAVCQSVGLAIKAIP